MAWTTDGIEPIAIFSYALVMVYRLSLDAPSFDMVPGEDRGVGRSCWEQVSRLVVPEGMSGTVVVVTDDPADVRWNGQPMSAEWVPVDDHASGQVLEVEGGVQEFRYDDSGDATGAVSATVSDGFGTMSLGTLSFGCSLMD